MTTPNRLKWAYAIDAQLHHLGTSSAWKSDVELQLGINHFQPTRGNKVHERIAEACLIVKNAKQGLLPHEVDLLDAAYIIATRMKLAIRKVEAINHYAEYLHEDMGFLWNQDFIAAVMADWSTAPEDDDGSGRNKRAVQMEDWSAALGVSLPTLKRWTYGGDRGGGILPELRARLSMLHKRIRLK